MPSSLVVLLGVLYCVHSALIGIDMGSQFVKVSLVKAGAPLQIVEDETSKRKFPLQVAFGEEGERLFGNAASALSLRKPESTLLDIRNWVPGHSVSVGDITINKQEALAMMLEYIAGLASKQDGALVRDAVLTVPAFWTQQQRRELFDAASLAGVNVLSMVSDTSAAALQLGIEKPVDLDVSSTACIYNMGATGTTAAIIKYSSYVHAVTKRTNKTVGQFEVIGLGYDESLGGNAFRDRIVDRFVGELKSSLKLDPTELPRVMAKLRNSASKVKEILSANTAHPVYIEGVHGEHDFESSISREEFEDMASDLFARVTGPVDQALSQAGMATFSEIDSFVLIGGGIRVPKVASTLKSHLGIEQFNLNLNGDEASAFGAALHAANVSDAFRVRQYGMVDLSPYPIGVRLDGASTDFSKSRSPVFAVNSPIPSRSKSISTDHVSEDLHVTLFYDTAESTGLPLPGGSALEFLKYEVTGVAEALKKLGDAKDIVSVGEPSLKLTFKMQQNGLAEVTGVRVIVEVQAEKVVIPTPVVPPPVVVETPVEEEASSTEESSPEQASDPELVEIEVPVSPDMLPTESVVPEAPVTPEIEIVSETRSRRVSFKRVQLPGDDASVAVPSAESKKLSLALLDKLRTRDQSVAALGAALNAFESFIYSTRSKLTYEDDYIEQSSEDERTVILEQLELAEDWLYDNGELHHCSDGLLTVALEESESVDKYTNQLKKLQELTAAIFFRVAEAAKPPVVEEVDESNATVPLGDSSDDNTTEATEQYSPLENEEDGITLDIPEQSPDSTSD